jgi:hypothetical protein
MNKPVHLSQEMAICDVCSICIKMDVHGMNRYVDMLRVTAILSVLCMHMKMGVRGIKQKYVSMPPIMAS